MTEMRPVADGAEVGPLLRVDLHLVAADPVVLLPARVDLLDDRVAVAPAAHARQRVAGERLAVDRRRHVDVEERVRREPPLQHPGGEARREVGRDVEAEAVAADGRDRDRRHAEERPLHRRGDGPGVGDVVAEVARPC